MTNQVKPKFLWFRISIALGLLLGIVLLAQTVVTYLYVSNSLVRQEAQREADRRLQSISRAARLTGSRESSKLTPVLHELVHESAQQLAWIRILNMDGKVIAESEQVKGAPDYKNGELGKLLDNRGRRPVEREGEKGKLLIIVTPLRLGPPLFNRPPDDPAAQIAQAIPPTAETPDGRGTMPDEARGGRGPTPDEARGSRGGRGGRGGRGSPEIAEIALYLNGISANFLPLQENLIVGCTAAFALMGAVIVIGLRFRHYMRGKHIEEELSLARRVQLDLFPKENSLTSSLAFSARCVPAYQVGGDLYDVFEMDNGEVGLVLGDVSGKGLPAALLMGVVQGAVRASAVSGPARNHEHAAERLNHLLCVKTARERFVSLFWCYVDQQAQTLRYINAGHLPPLLLRHNGPKLEVLRLDSGGTVLGLLPAARYKQAEVAVEPGDLLIVFSDGILEAANSADEEFGEEGVVASAEKHWKMPPNELCSAMLEDVRTFLGKELPHDDQTLLIVRLGASGVNPAGVSPASL